MSTSNRTFEYADVEDAIARDGLRMVVLSGVPSSWTEAAKGLFHIKRIPWVAVRLVYDNEALKAWAGQLSAPVVAYNDEPRISGWAEILSLAERLAPDPAMLPANPVERARALELGEKFCAPNGLGWMRRLQNVHAGLQKSGGFNERIAGYLGKKYGYTPEVGATAGARTRELLDVFGSTLRARRAAGSDYYLDSLSAVDVYSATFMALFKPLPEAVCQMNPATRAAFEWLDAETAAAIDPILIEHRDMMYARHLALPLSL
jgi:glutathione S-transferase